MNALKQKLNKRLGFTMAETLLAILILLMVSAVVAAGIPAAKNAYEKVVLASNAEILLSTTMGQLRNELGTAMNIAIPDNTSADPAVKQGTTVRYRDNNTGSDSELYLGSDNGQTTILIKQSGMDERRLISEAVSTRDLYVSYDHVEYDPGVGVVTFNGLRASRTSNDAVLSSIDALSIHILIND